MSFCVLAHININLMETINNIQKVSCLRFVRLPHAGQRNYIEFDNKDGYVISLASHLCTIKFLCKNGGNMGNMGNVWGVCLNVAGRDSRVEVAGAGAGKVRGCG